MSFFESSLGQIPSYSWKSIWATKDTLEASLCWRIGTSLKVLVRTDAWILVNPNLRIQTRIHENSNQIVADLIDLETRKLKEDVIHSTFIEKDARRILAIPLSNVPHEDFLAWRGEAIGEYTVCSA